VGFTKLDEGILKSSIMAADPVTFKVWIALLAACEADGVARVAVPFLASVCRLSDEETAQAIGVLSGPDGHSRTPDNGGRRIERCSDGWRINNYFKYRRLGLRAAESEARNERRHVRAVSGQSPDPSASASASASASVLSGEGVQGEGRRQQPANPLIRGKRPDLEHRAYRAIERLKPLLGLVDGLDILARYSEYKGRSAVRVETMGDDWLARTVRDMELAVADLEKARGPSFDGEVGEERLRVIARDAARRGVSAEEFARLSGLQLSPADASLFARLVAEAGGPAP
jgi:hypothetical protein